MIANRHRAVTLMELLVVVSLVGMLMALLLPAVQASRESARRATCQEHLKQLGLAMLSHESAKKRFPSGGWGFAWVGDPDRGSGPSQPGGWVYSLLPYIERGDLVQLGKGKSEQEKKNDMTLVVQIPIGLFNCPSRRSLRLSLLAPNPPPRNFHLVGAVAQTDYAVNAGDVGVGGGPGPRTLAEGDNPGYVWHDTSRASGVCYLRSDVVPAAIVDGMSHTYLIGEKYVNAGFDPGDDQSMYSGFDYDTFRWARHSSPPLIDGARMAPRRFGSSHPGGCSFVFCDGSVHAINFSIDQEIHRRLANRRDRAPIDDAAWQ